MKNIIKKSRTRKICLLAGLACLAACLLFFAGCSVNINVDSTTLTVKSEDFSGSRVMVFSAPYDSKKTADVTAKLRENCPEDMTMSSKSSGNTTVYSFALSFTSQKDYTDKVTNITGKTAAVYFEPPDDSDVFTGGFTLRENFSTTDLFAWAVAAADEDDIKLTPKTKDSKTTVVLDGVSTTTDATPIDIKKAFAPLDSVVISTDVYGSDDFVRTVRVNISQESLDILGKEKLEKEFFARLKSNIPKELLILAGFTDETDDPTPAYIFRSAHCTRDGLDKFTNALFSGSTLTVEESEAEPFSVSHKITETIALTEFVCNKDRTANGALVYNAMESDTINGGEKSYSVPFSNASSASAEFISHSVYELSGVEVSLDMSLSGRVTFGVAVSYKDESTSKSAAELAESYFAENWPDMKIDVTAGSASGSDTSETCQLVLTASGSAEDVTDILANRLGTKNSIRIESRKKFTLFETFDVAHSVDVAEFCGLSGYAGEIGYSFTSAGGRVKGVQLTVDGKTEYDLLGGETSGGGFRYGGIARPVFSIAYVNQRINIAFVVLVVLGGAAVLSVIGIFSRMAIRKSRGKKRFSEDEITLEAVQSVALANLPAEQQTISELPPELSSRQVVVIQPRQDDGLDEHGDEPENAWLFGTALKMMSVLCFALFFVNFASISTEDWRSTLSKIPVIGIFVSPEAGLTGYKIAGGAEIFGVQMPGWPLAYCLVAAPVVIFLLMSFRRKLPKLLASAGTLAISVSQIFLLLFMPPVISQNVEIIRQSTKNYVTDPVLGMGYNYSLVIYILLTVGTLILMISDILEAVKKKGRT